MINTQYIFKEDKSWASKKSALVYKKLNRKGLKVSKKDIYSAIICGLGWESINDFESHECIYDNKTQEGFIVTMPFNNHNFQSQLKFGFVSKFQNKFTYRDYEVAFKTIFSYVAAKESFLLDLGFYEGLPLKYDYNDLKSGLVSVTPSGVLGDVIFNKIKDGGCKAVVLLEDHHSPKILKQLSDVTLNLESETVYDPLLDIKDTDVISYLLSEIMATLIPFLREDDNIFSLMERVNLFIIELERESTITFKSICDGYKASSQLLKTDHKYFEIMESVFVEPLGLKTKPLHDLKSESSESIVVMALPSQGIFKYYKHMIMIALRSFYAEDGYPQLDGLYEGDNNAPVAPLFVYIEQYQQFGAKTLGSSLCAMRGIIPIFNITNHKTINPDHEEVIEEIEDHTSGIIIQDKVLYSSIYETNLRKNKTEEYLLEHEIGIMGKLSAYIQGKKIEDKISKQCFNNEIEQYKMFAKLIQFDGFERLLSTYSNGDERAVQRENYKAASVIKKIGDLQVEYNKESTRLVNKSKKGNRIIKVQLN